MLQPDINSKDQLLGNSTAPLILVEYGDYQCPHCRMAHPHVKKIIETYSESIAFIFRNFPITEVHPMAYIAAVAAESAALKGKYWEMHNAIFEQQQKLSKGKDGLIEIALSAGVESEHINASLSNSELQKKVDDDFESGILSGVNGTPTFFINGVRHTGLPTFSALKEVLDSILASDY